MQCMHRAPFMQKQHAGEPLSAPCREKDLNEVVQTTTIFANVSKGVLAKHEDMQAVFGTTDEDAICRRILADGDLQVRQHPGR